MLRCHDDDDAILYRASYRAIAPLPYRLFAYALFPGKCVRCEYSISTLTYKQRNIGSFFYSWWFMDYQNHVFVTLQYKMLYTWVRVIHEVHKLWYPMKKMMITQCTCNATFIEVWRFKDFLDILKRLNTLSLLRHL